MMFTSPVVMLSLALISLRKLERVIAPSITAPIARSITTLIHKQIEIVENDCTWSRVLSSVIFDFDSNASETA